MSTKKTKPGHQYPGDRVGRLSPEVPGELAELIDLANSAIDPILADGSVWAEEASRKDATILTWPPVFQPADGLSDFLTWCATEAVDNVLNAMARSQGMPDGSQRVPEDTESQKFQVVLRVCNRAVQAADFVIRSQFAKAGRIDGKRALEGWLIRKHIDHLQRAEPGISVAAAAARIGVSTAAAYRWLAKP